MSVDCDKGAVLCPNYDPVAGDACLRQMETEGCDVLFEYGELPYECMLACS
jgi:hypothetical protein